MNPDSTPSVSSPRRHGFPWFPAVVGVLAVSAIVWTRTSSELERNLQSWATALVVLIALALNLLWFLVTPRFRWRTRLGTLGLLIAAAVGLKNSLKVDGTIDGTGLPNLTWKWTRTGSSATTTNQAPAVSPAPPVKDPRLTGATDVPQFFGPLRTGVVEGAGLSADWDKEPPKELWRQPIGGGWSAFAVVDGLAYTQEQRGEEEWVSCYELLTGKLVWRHADPARFTQWQGGEGPRATPTIHEGRVYSYGGTGILNCLEARTGRRLWTVSVLETNGLRNIEWGVSASPLISGGNVVVTGGDTTGPVLFAYGLGDGRPVWKGGQDRASYASPIEARLAGRRVILSNNAAGLAAYDPGTGELLVEHRWGNEKWPKASQPLVLEGDRVFLSAGYGMGCFLLSITNSPDGRLVSRELWRGMRMKTQFNSATALGGFVYGLDDGRLACVEIATGERRWKDGNFGSGQSLRVDDLILIQAERGDVVIADAKPDGYTERGRIKALSSKTWNHPTLAGRFLLVRNDREAVCYELPVKKPPGDAPGQR